MCDKSKLRLELTARRALAFEAVPDAGTQLIAHFPDAVEVKHQTIAAYMPFRTEIDPLHLLRALLARGGQGCLPRMSAPNTTLDQFATTNSPSHLWGGVGVGGGAPDTHTAPTTTTAPHPPTPSPQVGRGGAFDRDRARRLRAAPTKSEQKLWDLLRSKRPDGSHWRRQMTIGGYVFDFGCHKLKLLVEVDGGVHKLPDVQARDRIKEIVAREHGYCLIRLKNEQVLEIQTAQYFDQLATPLPPRGEGVGGWGDSGFEHANRAQHLALPPTPTPPHKGEGLLHRASLTFHLRDPNNHTHFQANKWGLLEPREDLPQVIPTILLVPLLGFDRQGNRIGYGKGYYDTTIRALKSQGPLTTIGLAFAAQEVPEIPTQSHDQRLDWIITENEAYRVPS